jgi:hypothetical protein
MRKMEVEAKTVERMGESFAQPDMQERFVAFAERAEKEARQEKKKEQKSSREINLADRSPQERQFIDAVAERDESAKKSPRESSTEKEATARTEQRTDAKAGEKPAAAESQDSHGEPIAADRYWERKLEGKEAHENHWRQVDGRVGVALEYINGHKEKEQIHRGLSGLVADRHPAFQRDLYTALAEMPNAGEVLRHIALQPQDREVLRNAKNPQELRAAVRTISKAYPVAASKAQTSPKPRAPKPPSEVGGRGAAGDDGTRGEADFGSFSRKMNQQYARR